MAAKQLIIALGMLAAASPGNATVQQPDHTAGAPQGGPNTLYCMRIEAITGSRIEEVKCWTRQEWADQDVDVDQAWPREGVRTLG
jgi:hypothetical protein